MCRPQRGEATASGARYDVIGGEWIHGVSPASLLAAQVADRLGADQRGTGSVVMAEASRCCASAASAVAPRRQRTAAEAGPD